VLFTGRREAVKLGAAVVLGRAPLGDDQPALLEAVQGGVQRSLFHLQRVVGALLDPARGAVALRKSIDASAMPGRWRRGSQVYT